MQNKSTENLEDTLKNTRIYEVSGFIKENETELVGGDFAFAQYFRDLLKKKGIKKQDVFLYADIPERYGYKLLNGEKKTRQRDIILRICYAGMLTLDETQRALRLYQMPELYARIPRDAVLMIAFNERPGSIIEVNTYLSQNGFETLRSSGIQE